MTDLDHECAFPEVIITGGDEDDNLKAGMRVLLPCSCGETPLDSIQTLQMYLDEFTETLKNVDPRRQLYHWAPALRRKQILRYGLRPGMRPTTSTGMGAPCICFADTPGWAWALSGNQHYAPSGGWDLWTTALDLLQDPIILPGPEQASGIYEIRTEHRVYKRHLWYVGSRMK